MRVLLSIVGLLVVLAVVLVLVRQQTRMLAPMAGSTPPGASGPAPMPRAVQQMQQDVQRQLDLGAARTASQAE